MHCGDKHSASVLASYCGDVVVLGCCGPKWRLESRGWDGGGWKAGVGTVEVRQQRVDSDG